MAVPSEGAAIANTYMTTGANAPNNVREDLADVIYRIDPETTPMVTAMGTGPDAEQITSEWLVQELQAADANVQPEGFRYLAQPLKKPARLNNICQIMFRAVTVSNTLRASDTVGGDEWDRQLLLKGKETRRDLEWWVTRDKVKTAVDPRQMSGIQTWITNGSMGTGGSLGAGDGTTAPQHGTARTLTLDLITDAIQAAFTVGGHPELGLSSPRLKRAFSALAQGGAGNPIVAQNIVQATSPHPTTIVGAVDSYLSDFGLLQLAPDIFMPDGVFLLLDPDYMELAPLPGRDMVEEQYAKTGDAADGGVLFEGTMRVLAPKAHAMVGDLS
jgi:hypothetical protein